MSPFDYKSYINDMLKDPKDHIRILALFAQLKRYKFENKEQVQFFISRNVRAAKRLTCFDFNKIKRTIEYLLETMEFKITLETVEKYILESFEQLTGETPIIILKNGEEIYDTKRLEELEKQNKIYYDGNRWRERNNNESVS